MIMKWFNIFLCSSLLLIGVASKASENQADELTSAMVTREQLAKLLVHFSRAPIDAQSVQAWRRKLDDESLLQTDNTFESQLQVRDVALTVLEAITGESFIPNPPGKTTPVKEILARQVKGTVWRFHIAKLTDDDYESVSRNVDYWIAGYLQGSVSKTTPGQSPRRGSNGK